MKINRKKGVNKLDYVKDIEKIGKDTEEKKTEKIRLEEQLKALNTKEEDLLKELKELGINREDLEKWIADKKEAIEKGITQCQEILQRT